MEVGVGADTGEEMGGDESIAVGNEEGKDDGDDL